MEGVKVMYKLRILFFSFVLFILGSIILNAQWKEVIHTQGQDKAIVVNNTNIYTGFDRNIGAFLSTDQGTTWTPIDSGLTSKNVGSFVVRGADLFAGTAQAGNVAGVFMSKDKGTNWAAINTGLTSLQIGPLLVSGTYLFAGSSGGGAFRLNINNINAGWTPIDSGLTMPNVPTYYLDSTIDAYAVIGTNLFAASNNGVFLSTNNGASWDSVNTGLPGRWPTEADCFAVNGTNLFVGTNGSGIFLSTNNGASWDSVNTGLTDRYVTSLQSVDATHLLAGTKSNGVFLSTNNGGDWTPIDFGLTNLNVFCLAFDGTYLYAGTGGNSIQGGGVWRRPLSEITGIKEVVSNQLPHNYLLQQNYPNPFNPTTIINYTVPKTGLVVIKVYNILGKKITTLVNGEKSAGNYTVKLSAERYRLSSGIYFYRMTSGNFVETKKMILMK
jgi:hypothetical protein